MLGALICICPKPFTPSQEWASGLLLASHQCSLLPQARTWSMFLVAGVTLSPAVTSLNHPVHPHHPILIHNCFSVFTFLYPCWPMASPMAGGWCTACSGGCGRSRAGSSAVAGTGSWSRAAGPARSVCPHLGRQPGAASGKPWEHPVYGSLKTSTLHHCKTKILFRPVIITAC